MFGPKACQFSGGEFAQFQIRRVQMAMCRFFSRSLLISASSLLQLTAVVIPAFMAEAGETGPPQSSQIDTAYPILFVTQIPIAADFTTITSTFGNHIPSMQDAGRGGDLWIRYPDGMLKNLTAAAGYGRKGRQNRSAIAVRDPSVHWSGKKAIFSMAIGAPDRYQWETYYWQLYEVTGLGREDRPVIRKLANQPEKYNNVSPVYGTDDRVIFTSDRPFNGQGHLYPQLDEYEADPANSGLWSLDPTTGDIFLLNHAPSGDFAPSIDSKGRVVFTQWDHLQRDQQADADALSRGKSPHGSFNYRDESAKAEMLKDRSEVFPEPRPARSDLLKGTSQVGHLMNHFFPWTINEDGTGGEVLLHLGRHELTKYAAASLRGDPNVVDYFRPSQRANSNSITNVFQIKETPNEPGTFYAIDAPEFGTHTSGNVIRVATEGLNADQVVVDHITDPQSVANGLYREPLPLANGSMIVVHSTYSASEKYARGISRYDFRLKALIRDGDGYWKAGPPLTKGIIEKVSYWDPDEEVSYSGVMWELNPAEVRPRKRPTPAGFALESPELELFRQAGVGVAELQRYMSKHNLALAVSRNVTTRDDADRQQPFNLRIVGGGAQTTGAPGRIYDIAFIEFFEGQLIRGYSSLRAGRRVLAQPMRDETAISLNPRRGASAHRFQLAADGSMAAFVPARRAMSWQLTDAEGNGIVRERYWVTFQPGEIRVCTSCHGLNDLDQSQNVQPTNPPKALLTLLKHWRARS